MSKLDKKHILLIIGGGIAAYKSLDLIRKLKAQGAEVTGILTEGARQFITPLSVASLTTRHAYTDLFDASREGDMGHIELSRAADLILAAPATANLMARMAHGQADDLASTVLLATDTPVMIAPAMNVRMWTHAATRRNLTQLKDDGVAIIGPEEGDMACGEYGPGRMSEPGEIVQAVAAHFAGSDDNTLAGRKIVVTAGPTHEPVDPVRYLANRSSGRQGYAIADMAARMGAQVILISGPTALETPPGVVRIDVETAAEMLDAVRESLPADIGVFTAAVADWRAAAPSEEKLKKSTTKNARAGAQLTLKENPDILKTIAADKGLRPTLVIGFAAETENVLRHARAKRKAKKADWMVANDVSPGTGIMGGLRNQVALITDGGEENWPSAPKGEIAQKLLRRAAKHLKAAAGANTRKTGRQGAK